MRVLLALQRCSMGLFIGFLASPVYASADQLNSGDTGWMLTSTALVLFMTIPGLALFYGGLVRVKNVLSSLVRKEFRGSKVYLSN